MLMTYQLYDYDEIFLWKANLMQTHYFGFLLLFFFLVDAFSYFYQFCNFSSQFLVSLRMESAVFQFSHTVTLKMILYWRTLFSMRVIMKELYSCECFVIIVDYILRLCLWENLEIEKREYDKKMLVYSNSRGKM